VRKQRSRAANKPSSLQRSVSAADLEEGSTRPHSPTGSSVDLDESGADWTFAKREHAFARLGLDPALDNLPDEDLNRLFEKITKVKTMRDHIAKPRPESSLSQAMDSFSQGIDDVWSESGRAFDAFTDDTSVDANGTPDTEVRDQLESQRVEFESRLRAIGESSEAEDLKAEKQQMEHQLKLIQNQMKRIIDARARGEEIDKMEFEPTIYSAKQLKLFRKVLDKWRAHQSFSMAEVVLSSAVVVKEANVIR
jgi:kinesin family protein 1